MPLTVACAKCAKELCLPKTLLGRLVSCPGCRAAFTVVDDGGRLSVRLAGEPDPPPAPAHVRQPGRTSQVPLVPLPVPAPAPRPFAFRVGVRDDPEGLLVDPVEARVTTAGMELRDRDGRRCDVPLGEPALYLGGNRLRVRVQGHALALRVTQPSCQQARLAHDLALFLSGQRGPLRPDDYRPRRLKWLLPAVPLLAAGVCLALDVVGWVGALTWIGLGLVASVLTGVVVRNEAMTHQRRLVWTGAVWGAGLLPLLLLVYQGQGPLIKWHTAWGDNDKWGARFPTWPDDLRQPLFGDPQARVFTGVTGTLAGDAGVFQIVYCDLADDEREARDPDAHCHDVRTSFLAMVPDARADGAGDIALIGHPGKEFLFRHPDGRQSRLRVYLVESRLYVLRATWNQAVPEEDVDEFFDCFKLHDCVDLRIARIDNLDLPRPVPPDRRGPPPWAPRRPPGRLALPAPAAIGGLRAHWAFNEGQGTHVEDGSGQGRHGTVRGGWWIDGVEGKALLFDGAGDYFTFGKADGLDLPARTGFSVTGWVATRQKDGAWLAMTNNKPHEGSMLRLEVRGGSLHATVRPDAGVYVAVKGGGRIDDGVWHHAALVRDDLGGLQLYLDGEPLHPPTTLKVRGAITTDFRALGCQAIWCKPGNDPREFCACAVDEVCVFDRALTPQEIHKLAGQR